MLMPRKDIYHDIVVEALIEDGWTITADPLTLPLDDTKVLIDLAAEKNLIEAEKGPLRIAVEIKSYLGQSVIVETQRLLGQLDIYAALLEQYDPDRELIMAIPQKFYKQLLGMPMLRKIINNKGIRKCVFDEVQKKVTAWID